MSRAIKEFHRLLARIDGVTDGQASIGNIDWENGCLHEFQIIIKPNAGYYKGGKFQFSIKLPSSYPCEQPPVVWCDTPIFHPNIDYTDTRLDTSYSNVCLNILSTDWNSAVGLEGVVLGLIFLLYNPNPNEALNYRFEYGTGAEEFAEKVKLSLAGGELDGFQFQPNIDANMETDNHKQVLNAGAAKDIDNHDNADFVTAAVQTGTESEVWNTTETTEQVDETATDPDMADDDELAFQKLMTNECTLQDELEEAGITDKGIVMMNGGGFGIVIGASESGVDLLNSTGIGMIEDDWAQNKETEGDYAAGESPDVDDNKQQKQGLVTTVRDDKTVHRTGNVKHDRTESVNMFTIYETKLRLAAVFLAMIVLVYTKFAIDWKIADE